MNNQDVINEVVTKTGLEETVCEAVVKAFETQAQEALENKLKGIQQTDETKLAGISEKSGQPLDICEKVVKVLDEVLDFGLTNKLSFFKRNKKLQ